MVRQVKECSEKRSRAKRSPLPMRVEATIAVMLMGVMDYSEIASAVGLTRKEVKEINLADDPRIKTLASEGLPPGKRFRLARPLYCPKCRHKINIALCVACESRSIGRYRRSQLPGLVRRDRLL
jgi:hypothetical protein